MKPDDVGFVHLWPVCSGVVPVPYHPIIWVVSFV